MPEPVVSSQAAVPKEFASESSEPNSLREVLLFCVVLAVEVYSLAVAFGGPFFEVGYFLGVVISQTVAGAYIWAQLRRTDRTLPLPELLAMGFAIGSASAAISQLIIRDLLGIRLFLSPLVPIIGVAIWLAIRRTTQLPVRITHANTSTLLWLLFPAPLVLMNYSIAFLPTLIGMIFFIYFLIKNKLYFSKQLNLKIFSYLLLVIFFSSLIQRLSSILTASTIGIDKYSDDIRFDVIQAISSATWGLNTQAELANQTYAYYKLSFLWLAPIANFSPQITLNLSVTVIPIFLILILGTCLWAMTARLSNGSMAAGYALIVFFAQTNFSDDSVLNLRSGWVMASIYILSLGVMIKSTAERETRSLNFLLFIGAFVLAGVRITFIPYLIPLLMLRRGLLNQRKVLRKRVFLNLLSCGSGALLSLFIFTRGKNSTLLTSAFISSTDWPIDRFTTLKFVTETLILRFFLFLAVIVFLKKNRYLQQFTVLTSIIFLTTEFLVPRLSVSDPVFLFPYLLVLTPLIAIVFEENRSLLLSHNFISKKLIVISVLLGLITKILFDSFRENPNYFNFVKKFFVSVLSNQLLLSLSLIFSCLIVVILITYKNLMPRQVFLAALVVSVLVSPSGIFIGSQFRQITEYFRYGESFLGRQEDALLNRWNEPDLIFGLSKSQTIIPDDIIASNFGLSRDIGFSDSNRLQIFVNRRIYMGGNFNHYLRSLPLHVRQTYSPNLSNQRKNDFAQMLRERFETSMDFPNYPSRELLANMRKDNVKWFVVDLGNTQLRDWEPWATTRFMNEKVAILELSQTPISSG